ncbi:hypothetical protein R1sor_008410 [Riccia sorocarpa]|uniref:Uncharacterized protein n=1 Tax=Riccia sorocarpa TaxID=122646 RepID=A0ABD3HZJ5_9MARC
MTVDSLRGHARVLLVPIPAEGHFKPFLAIMRRLAKSRISFTVLCNQERCDELSRFQANGEFGDLDVDFMPLFKDFLKPFPDMLDDWKHRSAEIDPSRFTCMITDMFTYFIQDDADKWGIPRYTLITTGCYPGLYFIQGDKIVEGGWLFSNPDKRHQSITLPGLELFSPLHCPRMITFLPVEEILPKLAVSFRKSAGLLFNSFEALDKEPLEIMSRQPEITQFPGKETPKVFAVGPLVSLPLSSANFHELTSKPGDNLRETIDWLDGQRKSSVLFISLGSVRPLPKTGATAFAEALEQTGIPFFWVLRIPPVDRYIVDVLQIAVEVKYKEDYFDFDSETVTVAIDKLMDKHKGANIRQNVLNMQTAIFEAVREGGTSYRSFEEFISTILNHTTVT